VSEGSAGLKRIIELVQQYWSRSLLVLSSLVSLASILLMLATSIAQAAPARKLVRPGQLMIDGFVVKCGTTPALISESYPDFGAARRGLIILNPLKLRALPRGAKLLIYYHECAHQYVGGSELAADCWAVQKVRREGLMNRAGLKNACSFINKLPANRRHPPGAMRCRHMMRCYNDTFRARADKGVTKGKVGTAIDSTSNVLSNSGFSLVPGSRKPSGKNQFSK